MLRRTRSVHRRILRRRRRPRCLAQLILSRATACAGSGRGRRVPHRRRCRTTFAGGSWVRLAACPAIATSSAYFTPAILAPRSRLSRRLRAACRCRGLSRSSACGAGLLSNSASCTFAAEPPRHSIPPVRRARRARASRTDREDRPLCLFGRLRGSCAAGAVLLSCPASRTSAKTLPRNRVVPVRPAKARRVSRASVSLS